MSNNQTTTPPDALQNAVISAVIYEGFTCKTCEGKRLTLALVDDAGNIVEAGPAVAKEAWNVCIAVQRNFWKGQGHLRTVSGQVEIMDNPDVPYGFITKHPMEDAA